MVKTLLGLLLSISLNNAPVTTINYLVEHAPTRNGQTVIVEAEVIGEVLERGNNAWINVNDGSNAIGIWLTLDQTKVLHVFGDYFHTGDKIRIIGTFNRACVEHGGEMDIHAKTITVIKTGQVTAHPISSLKFVVTIILLSIALAGIYLKRGYFRKPKINTD